MIFLPPPVAHFQFFACVYGSFFRKDNVVDAANVVVQILGLGRLIPTDRELMLPD